MLKDRLFNINYNKEEEAFLKIKGSLKVFGFDKDKRLFHIDNGNNVVTTWAKQMFMKTFGGIPYLSGNLSDVNAVNYLNKMNADGTDHSDTRNADGSVVSNASYFSDVDILNVKNAGNGGVSPWADSYVPHFPTKMLFGTGMEFHKVGATWYTHFSEGGNTGDIAYNTGDYTKFLGYGLEGDLINEDFPADGINTNRYSNYIDIVADPLGRPKTAVRTVDSNDQTYLTNIKSTFSPSSTSLTGAIKNNFYFDKATTTMFDVAPTNSSYVVLPDYRGVGAPSFIYIDRTSIDNGEVSNIYVNKGTGIASNRITFQITMPNQQGPNYYYPYNGYYLREAGLYTDARLYSDTDLASNTIPGDAGAQREAYYAMLFGTLLAKRRIATIYKAFDNSYTFKWTLYIE